MIGERVLGLPPEPRVDRDVSYRELAARAWLTRARRTASTTIPIRCAREQDRLRMLSRVADGRTRRALTDVGIAPGWHCCDIGSGAGTIAAWMAEQVGPTGRVVSLDVDTRFQPPSAGVDRGPHARRDERADRRRTSSTSCTRARCCSISRSGKRCSTR